MLSPSWILGEHHAAGWGVLGLCALFLFAKRGDIAKALARGSRLYFVALGLSLIIGAILIPYSQDFAVFKVLLASLGVFVMLFGTAAKLPAVLMGVYGLAVAFPLAVERFAPGLSAQTALRPLMLLLNTLELPVINQGQMLSFTSAGGTPITVILTAACAGPATMGVFLAIFALMSLDMPLPRGKAISLFLFGVLGTWLQSVLRLAIIVSLGYYMGADALWSAHTWTIYVLFPLWYLFFAYIYFRQVKRPPEAPVPAQGRLILAGNG